MGANPLSLSPKSLKSLLISWRTLILILLITNWKALPGAWTARIWFNLVTSFRREFRRTIRSPTPTNQNRRITVIKKSDSSEPISKHPLFHPDTVTSHAPLMEIDYNLHKSNSTYFGDLDASRAKLMARLVAPVWPMNNMLIDFRSPDGTPRCEKVKGRAAVMLGAVHTSFKREIKPYAHFDVQSRILTWDNRWIYVGSWFISKASPGKDGDKRKRILASSVSKYIFKKGRITIRPELFLSEAGWIPPRPEGVPAPKLLGISNGNSTTPSGVATPEAGAPAPETAQNAVKRAADAALSIAASDSTKAATASSPSSTSTWTWEEIEAERARGLDVVSQWALTDGLLEEEFMATGVV